MKTFAPNNGRFKILTDTGFSDFIGVTLNDVNKDTIKISSDDAAVILTEDHKIYDTIDYNKRDASSFKTGDDIMTTDGIKKVTKIEKYKSKEVYDILHVFQNNRFYIKSDKKYTSCILIEQCLYLDEMGFVPNAEELYESVYPTISSSDKTKVIITSTPKGMNYFYKMWVEAETGRSEYIAYDVKWFEHPDRDQNWYNTMCANMNAMSIEQEVNCVGGSTVVNVDGSDMKIEELYMKYSTGHDNEIVYFNDILLEKRK